ALPCLAVPSTCKVVGLRRLNFIYGIEHDHAFGNLGSVIVELATLRITAPDFEGGCFHDPRSDISVGYRTGLACGLRRRAARNVSLRCKVISIGRSRECNAQEKFGMARHYR